MVGANPTQASRPGAVPREEYGSESTDYVSIPLDTLQEYFFKVSRAISRIPPHARLAWLEKADGAERASWVSEFREKQETLGTIIKRSGDRRAAHWEPPIMSQALSRPSFPPAPPLAAAGAFAKQNEAARKKAAKKGGKGGKGGGKGKTKGKGNWATHLARGDKVCPDFQRGTCNAQGDSCGKGVHRCAKILKSGRPCGSADHGAARCTK